MGGSIITLTRNPLIPASAEAVINRLALRRMRTEVCVIQRPADSRDAGGAPVTGVYGTVDVRDCRVVRSGTQANEFVRGGRMTADAAYEVRLPRDTDVREDDRIRVGDRVLDVTGPADVASHGTELIVPVASTS